MKRERMKDVEIKEWLEVCDEPGHGLIYVTVAGKTHPIFIIDSVETTIARIVVSLAKGFVINHDLTFDQCYVCKVNNLFAYGRTALEAQGAMREKIFKNMDVDEKIKEFKKLFPDFDKPIPGRVLYEWHHLLTGSSQMGRDAFCRKHDIDLNKDYTVNYFIEITKDDFGGEIIQKLKE